MDLYPTAGNVRRWFTRDAAFDAEVRRRFGYLLDRTPDLGDIAHGWRGNARSELALIVVADQFSRNLFRDDPRAFALDPFALSIARDLLLFDRARLLGPYHRFVALLPFEHAEDMDAQQEGLHAFTALVEEARAKHVPRIESLENGLEYARKHAAIIERFGRFPHRNDALGRVTTPEERAFLAQPGSRF
jgi:uncharacterized protein (DUF924 family)